MESTPDKNAIRTYAKMLKSQIEKMTERLNTESYQPEHEDVEDLLEGIKFKYQYLLDTHPEMFI